MNLLMFELRKIVRTNLFKMVLLSITVLLISYFIVVYLNAQNVIEQQSISDQNTISSNEERINELEALIENGQLNEEEEKRFEQEITLLEEAVNKAEMRLSGFENDDWEQVLSTFIENDQKLIEQEKQLNGNTSINRSLFTLESNLERNKLILEKEIKPIFPTGFSTTVYDQFDSERSQEAAEMKAEKFSSSALYFQKKLSDMAFNALGVLFLILIVIDITTKEGFRKDGPINLLYTQPINQLSLFLNKFMAGVIIILIALSSVMIISTALGFIFDRFGDWNFPILRYEEGELYSFINLGTYLVQALTLFICILIFSFTIYFLMSLMTNHLLVGLMCTLVIYLLGSGMTEIAFFTDYAQWNPFSYYSVASIVTQEQAALSGNWELTFGHGILTLSLSSLVILTIMLAFLQFKKKISL